MLRSANANQYTTAAKKSKLRENKRRGGKTVVAEATTEFKICKRAVPRAATVYPRQLKTTKKWTLKLYN